MNRQVVGFWFGNADCSNALPTPIDCGGGAAIASRKARQWPQHDFSAVGIEKSATALSVEISPVSSDRFAPRIDAVNLAASLTKRCHLAIALDEGRCILFSIGNREIAAETAPDVTPIVDGIRAAFRGVIEDGTGKISHWLDSALLPAECNAFRPTDNLAAIIDGGSPHIVFPGSWSR